MEPFNKKLSTFYKKIDKLLLISNKLYKIVVEKKRGVMQMKKIGIKLLFTLGILLGILCICNLSKAASNITLNTLDFQIQLKEDGSMDVTENWNASIRDTNTMFKTFKMDSSKFGTIKNVEVYEITNGNRVKLKQINEEMYHVTKGCYYGLIVSSGDFEIAWGVSIDSKTTKQYQLKYTVTDVVKNYNDCSEFYWQLVGNKNAIPVTKLTAEIYLPKAVSKKENVRAWAHGPYNGNISLTNQKISLEVSYLDPKVYVEARIATLEAGMFPKAKTVSQNKLNSILSQEQVWANKANQEREKYIKEKESKERIDKIIKMIVIVINVVLSICFLYKLIKNFIQLSKIEKPSQVEGIDYFREIPDETASAGDAAFLYYFKNGSFGANKAEILAATMLQLSLKKYITFSEDNTGKKPEIRVNLIDFSSYKEKMPPLKKDEQIVYGLLQAVGKEHQNTFTMKEFEKYAKNHSSSFISKIDRIAIEVANEQERLGNYDKKIIKQASNRATYGAMYLMFGISTIFMIPIAAIFMILNSIPSFMIAGRLKQLTEKGRIEQAKWKGLKKYMEDFSLLNEKEVPDLVLWEKFLVFATAFGISDKVIKQLKIKYPELQEMNGYNYAYMNLIYHSTLNTAFLSSLSTATNQVYMGGMSSQAASSYSGGNYSSGGGFGGGFSGGGGFGGGGGRNGR